MDLETQMNLIKSVVEGEGDFHKSYKKFKKLQKKPYDKSNKFQKMCKGKQGLIPPFITITRELEMITIISMVGLTWLIGLMFLVVYLSEQNN